MYFGKLCIILLVASCVVINAQRSPKRKMTKSKSKIKKPFLQNLGLSGCGCQNTLKEILNCGCRAPVIESVYASVPIPSAGPVIDVPNYRYAEPMELNPLNCLFPSIELNSYGVLASPMSVPTFEIIAPVLDVTCGCSGPCGCSSPCGCPGPKCGCNRVPVVKLPACPPPVTDKCGCQSLQLPTYSYGISSVIELPSFGPACGCQGPCSCAGVPKTSCECLGPCGCSGPCGGITLSACECMGPCSCAALPVSSCGCNGPCGCSGIASCGCNGPCGCGGISMSPCGCSGPCGCSVMPVSSCGCSGPCDCLGLAVSSCGCSGLCGCTGLPMSPCGCSGPSMISVSSCGCPSPCDCSGMSVPSCAGLPVSSCGCSGPCGCLGIQMPSYGCQLPTIEVPSCGCGCGVPGCGCNPKYLRQVVLPPPFL